jgi:hypothetical protein
MTAEMIRPATEPSLTRPASTLPFSALAAEPPEVSVAMEREVVERIDTEGHLRL